MIERYTLEEMGQIWSEQNRLEVFQEIQALVAEGWSKLGVAPPDVASAIRSAPSVSPEQVAEREKVTRHDTAAFVDLLAEHVGEGGEWVHYGLTSSDLLDSATGHLLAQAGDVLLAANERLFTVVRESAIEHRSTVMVGRTHGMSAEPTTFGLKLATWAFEIARNQERLRDARSTVAVGKISGAVGTYAHAPPEIEQHVLAGLGLRIEPASSQIVMRDRHAQYLSTLALVGSSLDRFATEIRHLARSEVGEVSESFGRGQKGSSAMPHKQNPVLSENVSGLARLLRGYALVGLENVALWHERDISHSSAERVVLPDASIVLHFALERMRAIVGGMDVKVDRMRANLEATAGLAFSQGVLLALIETGLSRHEAYQIVQEASAKATAEGVHLRQVLETAVTAELDSETIARCFDPAHYLRRADVVFERLEEIEL